MLALAQACWRLLAGLRSRLLLDVLDVLLGQADFVRHGGASLRRMANLLIGRASWNRAPHQKAATSAFMRWTMALNSSYDSNL